MNKDEIRRMANTCENYCSCALCPYNPEDIKRYIGDKWKGGCPNYDRKLVYAMGKGYRQIADDEQIIKTDQFYETLNSTLESGKRMGYAQGRDETARKIFEDIEFYSVRSLNDEMWGNHFKLTDCTMLDLKMKYGIDKEIVYKYRID